MATTKIHGSTQIQDLTITNTQISGTANIATSKLADGALFIKSDGTVSFTANLNMGNNNIVNVSNPINPQDAATKNYTDSVAGSWNSEALAYLGWF